MQKILVKGPVFSQSGYGEHARFVMRALRTREEDLDIYCMPIAWGNTGWIWTDDEERLWLDAIIEKTANHLKGGGQVDVSVQVTIPNEWEKMAPVNIGVTAGIETTKVAPQWIEKSLVVDKIITISEHSKQIYENTSYSAKNETTGEIINNFRATTPIHIVRYPVKKTVPQDIELDLETDFNYLTVAQWGPRKNIENTIRWFVEEFIDQEVGLIVKLNVARNCYYDRELCENQISHLLQKYKNRKCKVYLLHGYMSEEEMSALYSDERVKAYVTLTHGEGFGLPIFEAAYHGLPIIAPNWSGHIDFLYMPVKDKKGKVRNKKMFTDVEYTIENIPKEVVWDGVLTADSSWCVAEQGSYKMKLRELHKDYGRFRKRAKQLQEWICEELEESKQYEKMVNLIYDKEVHDLEEWLEELNVETHE